MSYLEGIDIGGNLRSAKTLDFTVPKNCFPLARYDLEKLRRDIDRDEVSRGPASV